MSRAFDECAQNPDAEFKTEKISTGRYRRICILGGNEFKGPIQTKKDYKRK